MKHAANIISGIRMALSLSMPFLTDDRTAFFIVFAACGFSDLLDGFVARRTGSQSALGARLDSIADMLFFFITLACVIIWAEARIWALLPYVIAIAGIRFVNMGIAFIKFRRFLVIHTWANKATGGLFFATLGVFILTDAIVALIPLCIIAALAALEETVILLSSKEPDPDRKSIFKR